MAKSTIEVRPQLGLEATVSQAPDNASKWLVLSAVGIGTFMSALDGSVVNTILPILRDAFHSNIAAVEWIVTIYLLVVSGLLLTFGRLGDLYGHKKVYVSGFIIFIGSSVLCGIAWSVAALVVFRALQAVGGAMLFSNSPAILTRNFPTTERGRALGLQATMTYLGLTAGPVLGGWLTHVLSWRSVFYINVPVGLLALALSLRFIPNTVAAQSTRRFDLIGAAAFMAGLICLLLGMNQGAEWGWVSPPIAMALLAAIVLLGSFIFVELRISSPMLNLRLFRIRRFTASVVSAVFNYICVYTLLFLLPFYLITGRGLNTAQAGLVLTAQPVVMAITAPISGALSDRIGTRLPSTLGMAILGIGLFLLSRIGAQSSLLHVAGGLAVCGFGTGIFISPNNSALMGAAPRDQQGVAGAVLATARNVGMVLGVGIAGAVFTTILGGAQADAVSGSLFRAIQVSMLVASGAAAIGTVVAALRGT